MVLSRKKNARKWILALGICYILLLMLHVFVKPMLDDLWYAERSTEMDLFSFLTSFYKTWSGRIPSNAITYVITGYLFDLWRFLNPVALMVLAFGMLRISGATISLRNYLATLMLFFFLGQGILDYGMLWATGSIYYLWPAAMAVFLLVPFIDLVFKQTTAIRFFPVYVVLAILAPMCSEQLTLCVLGCIFVTFIHYLVKYRNLPVKHLILLILSVLSAIVLFAAPGNAVRTQVSINEYYPTFNDMSVIDKITSGFPWLLSALFISLFLLIAILYAVTLFHYLKTKNGSQIWLRWVLICLFAFSVAMFLFSGPGSFLFSFANNAALIKSGGPLYTIILFFSYLLWGLFVAALFYLLGKSNMYFALGLLMAICSLAMMFFSPTIEASGERTYLFAGIIFIILIIGQIKKNLHPYFMTCISFLSAVGYLQLFFRMPYLPL